MPFLALFSLFLTPDDVPVQGQETVVMTPETARIAPKDLVLQGILYLPDTRHWIVWINGVRMDSRRPQSIMGWSVTGVHVDHVIVTHSNGTQRELWLSQDGEDDNDASSVDPSVPEDEAVLEPQPDLDEPPEDSMANPTDTSSPSEPTMPSTDLGGTVPLNPSGAADTKGLNEPAPLAQT